ncbi:MAG TPA: DUF488 family protein [Thermoanaerobaculia bacterium]
MAVRIVQLGTPRARDEGLRIGTVRRPPRGVKKEDYAEQNWYDVWLPDVAPSQELVSWALSEPWTDERWKRYEKAYRSEMKEPEKQRLLGLLAALSKQTDFAVGCYCDDGTRCHRRILRELLIEAGAKMG